MKIAEAGAFSIHLHIICYGKLNYVKHCSFRYGNSSLRRRK